MQYEICYMTPTGDAIVLLRADIAPHHFPALALRVADIAAYVPGLCLVAHGHELTGLVISRHGCVLQGEKVRYYAGIDD